MVPLPHHLILVELKATFIIGVHLNGNRVYLKNGSFQMKVNWEKHTTMQVTIDVQRGFILAYLLFFVYVNLLPTQPDADVLIFADDTDI